MLNENYVHSLKTFNWIQETVLSQNFLNTPSGIDDIDPVKPSGRAAV